MVYKKLMAVAAQNGVKLVPAVYTTHVNEPTACVAAGTGTTLAATLATGQTLMTSSSQWPVPPVTNANTVPAPNLNSDTRPRPQHIRAYRMWHHHHKPLHAMCAELTNRGMPLKESTVM